MAVIERDVVLMSRDADGNQTIDMPITNLGNIEGTADIKTTPVAEDYVPVMDSADNGQMKKAMISTLLDITSGGSGISSDNPVFTGSISMGRWVNTVIGDGSVAAGLTVEASGKGANAEGCLTKATGDYSHSEGYSAKATGKASHAEGHSTASGEYSHSEGLAMVAANIASHACGKYGKSMKVGANTSLAVSSTFGDVMIIGNGTSSNQENLSNCFRVTYAGETYGLSNFNSSGADYAEYFEWLDGNPNSEDRVGHFVTLDGDKIRIASSGDYILGIVSGQPCIIGNADEDWLGRWEHDEFGRFVLEYLDEDGKVVDYETSSWRYKANPDYDASQPYVERKDRREWSAVGMLGVLSVRDDGSCQVNGFCQVAENGIATATSDEFTIKDGKITKGYRVVERVTSNVVEVIFK